MNDITNSVYLQTELKKETFFERILKMTISHNDINSSKDNIQLEKNIEKEIKKYNTEKIRKRFLVYSGGKATEAEINEAFFNFFGFVKTVLYIANDNKKGAYDESSCINPCFK